MAETPNQARQWVVALEDWKERSSGTGTAVSLLFQEVEQYNLLHDQLSEKNELLKISEEISKRKQDVEERQSQKQLERQQREAERVVQNRSRAQSGNQYLPQQSQKSPRQQPQYQDDQGQKNSTLARDLVSSSSLPTTEIKEEITNPTRKKSCPIDMSVPCKSSWTDQHLSTLSTTTNTNELNCVIQEMTNKKQQLVERLELLRSELGNLNSRKVMMENEPGRDQEILALRANLDNMKQEMQGLKTISSEYDVSIASHSAACCNAEKKMVEIQKQIVHSINALAQLKCHTHELNRQTTAKSHRISTLKRTLEMYQHQDYLQNESCFPNLVGDRERQIEREEDAHQAHLFQNNLLKFEKQSREKEQLSILENHLNTLMRFEKNWFVNGIDSSGTGLTIILSMLKEKIQLWTCWLH
eukprot:TRINITY_DN5225_c1_g1_i3.p1 TRINITY_DN5225_c1_g1~~TRINITY_DN5225_c1_g1_i3.p1  ORF type:complete len:414 (-),score=115.11 TRINITY_DN5225_c1_g1_i3:249-1490(-)